MPANGFNRVGNSIFGKGHIAQIFSISEWPLFGAAFLFEKAIFMPKMKTLRPAIGFVQKLALQE
jgi:hypothetical protein